MRKVMMMSACVMLISVVSSFGFGMVVWGDGGLLLQNDYTITDSSGVNLSTNGGYLFQLVLDTGGDTDFTSMLSDGYWAVAGEDGSTASYNTDDDVTFIGSGWTGHWTAWSTGSGLFSVGPNVTAQGSYTNIDFYIRWFNGSTVGASEAGIIYNTVGGWTTGDGIAATPSANLNYATGDSNLAGSTGTYGGVDGWATMAPIPEPGTIFLMGIGAAAVLARKRFRK